MGNGFRLRDAGAADRPFLHDMLVEAVNWTGDRPVDRATVATRPDLIRYVAGWPVDQEIGLVAEAEEHAIGACWLRYFTSEEPGYGYVSEDVPELSIAVAAAWRGNGVGRLLLRRTADLAAQAGVARISLSVERANRARHLYEAEGYQVVERGTAADTMILDL